jgi:ubiquitin-hydrolase Zn-finger-containing protein
MADICSHLSQIDHAATPSGVGCEDCLKVGGRWVHLRMCRACGHIGCCDSSPAKHASAHFRETSHALVSSYEPNETWWWCYADQVALDVTDEPDYSYR